MLLRGEATTAAPTARPGWRRALARALFAFGVMSLCYILGASVIYFDLPTADFLRKAFGGGLAWYESKPTQSPGDSRLTPVRTSGIDQPGKTCDGFTLLMYGADCRAVLVNMTGRVVHEWHVPFSQLWPEPKHLRGRIEDATVYFNDGYLYPNGDIVLVVEGPTSASNPSNGYGLVKLDKDSRVLWKYAARCHHDVDVAEDGTIYALVNETMDRAPRGLEFIPAPYLTDDLHVLSPDGVLQKRIHLLDAFQDTPYQPLLSVLDRPPAGAAGSPLAAFREDDVRRDVLHTNAVKALRTDMAAHFPQFRAGHLLVSPRRLDAIAVVDPGSEKVIWAARGPWRAQHDPSFLENGRFLLFDNLGAPKTSRAIEFDPRTLSFPWTYPGKGDKPFISQIRGMCQRLRNGNTLVVNSVGGEALEVTAQHEVVWSCSSGEATLNRARRYMPDQAPFVKEPPREHP